jgi:hypothetical protein
MENIFINSLYPKKPKYDFIVAQIGLKVEDFEQFLKDHRDWAINDNKGWLQIDILKTKGDADKFYCKMTKYANGGQGVVETTSSNHMPDREISASIDDLPF